MWPGIFVLFAAIAMIIAATYAGIGARQGDARAQVELHGNGRMVDAAADLDDALREATGEVGFPVRAPLNVPTGLAIKSVPYHVGPVAPDQDGMLQSMK
jgi:hypothetical protein